jgi:hypothetical protein
MKHDQFLTIPENRECVRIISQQILTKLRPGEISLSEGLIDPLMNMYADGKKVTLTKSDKAGGFGGSDLMVMILVPIVINVLSNLLTEYGKNKMGELKEQRKKSRKDVIREGTSHIIMEIRPFTTKKETNLLMEAIDDAVEQYLEE